VISPLLANITINRLLKVFAASGLEREARSDGIISYADDFVVVSRNGAAEVLTRVERWLEGMKLTLNDPKTRIVDAKVRDLPFPRVRTGTDDEQTDLSAGIWASSHRRRQRRTSERR